MPVTLSHDLVTGFLSFLLTLMILSYLIGDNPAFRVAISVFVGVSAGYVAAVVWWQVLYPRVIEPLIYGGITERSLALVPLILGVLLLMKLSPRTAWLGNSSVAFLVGVGASSGCGWGGDGDDHPTDTGIFSIYLILHAPENPGWRACSLEQSCWLVP